MSTDLLKKDADLLLKDIGHNIYEKFKNINGKTSQGSVPSILWQKRTPRNNRVLISWKTVLKNNFQLHHLETFDGGVCVEFMNDDFWNEEYKFNKLHQELKSRIGSDENVASIISFRTEDGYSGSNIPRDCYEEFLKRNTISLKPIIRKPNIKYYGKGNNVWEGNIFYSIKGGQQQSIESHAKFTEKRDKSPQLFNPAIDYANDKVCYDIFITLFYFFIHCHDINDYIPQEKLRSIKNKCEEFLKKRDYDDGDLYHYCIHHPCLIFDKDILMDPIAVERISVKDFNTDFGQNNPSSIALCHDESVNKKIFKYDQKNKFILSATRPHNIFWSKHSSNMIQQNFTLQEFFHLEERRVSKRKRYLNFG